VVWAVSQGQLPYRDIFDNHMPLFAAACAPYLRLLGENPRVMIELRLVNVPVFFFCLWCVFRLTETLFSRRLAPWTSLSAAALPGFLYTSTEFRPDVLWAAVWLFTLVVALCGPFTLRRAFASGVLLGLTLGISIKTPVLWTALTVATVIALGLNAILGKEKMRWSRMPLYLVVIGCGAALIPSAIVLFFAWKGAFWIMYYCLIRHNMLPGLKRWGLLSWYQWYFPLSIPPLIALGWLVFRQAPDGAAGVRRTILLLTPCLFAALLASYAPDITRQDVLPYLPLLPLVPIPLLAAVRKRLKFPQLETRFFTQAMPAICLLELVCVWTSDDLLKDHVKKTTEGIHDVLLLSRPGEYVMDSEGDCVFRPRPCYWVMETVTRARIKDGSIRENVPTDLVKTETGVCYLYAQRFNIPASLFIMMNYLPFDPSALSVGAAGKELGDPAPDGTFNFDVTIPQTYGILSELGATAGVLDGVPYKGPVRLAAGHHVFHRTSGRGRAAIFLDRALAAGFLPLFDESENMIATVRSERYRTIADLPH
jgi:hypothetical protein